MANPKQNVIFCDTRPCSLIGRCQPFFKTFVTVYKTAWRHIPEDSLHSHCYENLMFPNRMSAASHLSPTAYWVTFSAAIRVLRRGRGRTMPCFGKWRFGGKSWSTHKQVCLGRRWDFCTYHPHLKAISVCNRKAHKAENLTAICEPIV
jgi:hypothetical protein